MELVLDANVLVAAFLRSATTRELLLDERLTLWVPEHGLTEAERVLTTPRLRRRLGTLSIADVRLLLARFTLRVRVLPASAYQHHLAHAQRMAPHAEDAPYLALAMHLRLPLWSNDLALKDQNILPVYTTEEVLALLHSRSD